MTAPPIYLDYNATTPIDPAVLDAMLPYLREQFGNPSSTHAFGKTAHEAVEKARAQLAGLIEAEPEEIVFTGGGSEASNQAIKGTCLRRPRGLFARFFGGRSPDASHIITTAVEHPATLQPVEFLRRLGCQVTILPVDWLGMVNPDDVRRAITPRTTLVSVMHSNNEVGTLMPIREIAAVCRERGVLVHTDCAQSLGKVPVNVRELGVDLLTVAGHKLYAPKGVGALFVRRGVALEPLIHGAGHENGRRAGTENVPYLVGLGKAAELAAQSRSAATGRLRQLRDRLHERLKAALGERLTLNGHPEHRLPNTLNVNFAGHVGSELLEKVPGIAASTGSACHEGKVFQSPVLCAMGVPPEVGRGAVRLTVGRFTTEDEIDHAADLLIRANGPA
ncbi:MAG TPA: cysteine desulfurase family protein, partial [Gemmataceae bacterium]|nr:cysteine desulfurase family protein [Gemmataceae bacterium]